MTCFVKNVAFWLARIPNFTVRITGTAYMAFSTSLRAETVDGVRPAWYPDITTASGVAFSHLPLWTICDDKNIKYKVHATWPKSGNL